MLAIDCLYWDSPSMTSLVEIVWDTAGTPPIIVVLLDPLRYIENVNRQKEGRRYDYSVGWIKTTRATQRYSRKSISSLAVWLHP